MDEVDVVDRVDIVDVVDEVDVSYFCDDSFGNGTVAL